MRLYVAIIILGLAAIATAVGLAKKPIEPPIQIDAQSPGVWGRYAAATAVPTQPDLVCMYVFVPGQVAGAHKPVTET